MSSVQVFCACQAPLKPNNFDDFFRNLEIFAGIVKKLAFTKKKYFFKIKLDDQPCDASESRANFWGYVGNQKHPNYPHGHFI